MVLSRKHIPTSRERISRGSLEEIIDDFNVCIDDNYCRGMNFDQLKEDGYELILRINSYISYLRKSKEGED